MGAKRGVGIAVAVVVLAGVPGIGTASAAATDRVGTPGWAVQTLPIPTAAPNGHLSAVSCLSATSCSAVGYSHDGRGVDISLAEHWDGGTWTIQPTPNPDTANDSFLTGVSCTARTACTAVGDFVNAAGRQVAFAEHWNGRRWDLQPMPSPAGATESFLTAVSCSSPTVCVAVGYARRGSDQTTTVAQRWDHGAWHLQSTPNVGGATSSRLSSVSCTSGSVCTAVGFSGDMFANPRALSEHWNGTGWDVQPVPEPSGATQSLLSSVSCPTATQCVSVGRWHDNRKGGGTLAEHWDGSNWIVQPTPGGVTDLYTAVSCTSGSACLVVGKSGLSDYVAARWDGTAWTSTAAPASGTLVDSNYVGLSCVTADACVAIGVAETAAFDFTYLTQAARWDGSGWTTQSTPNPSGATTNELVAVSCPTARFCVAVGLQWKGPDAAQPLVERWNGTGWVIDSTPPVQGSSLQAVSCTTDNDCVAVGSYTDSAGAFAPLAEHWNGASWQVEPTPAPAGSTAAGFSGVSCTLPGSDSAAHRVHSVCVAVGQYADSSGAGTSLAERRNGTTWQVQAVPAPTGTTASALSAVSCAALTECVAVGAFQTGSFTTPGPAGPCDFSCNLSEHWDGTAWDVSLPPAPPTSINSSLPSVSCSAPAACVAAGQWTPQDRAGGHPGITLAESWTGAGWAVQATPDPPGVGGPDGTNNSPFEAVSCADVNACTAVGNYDSGDANGDFLPLAERRDASAWSVQRMPSPLGTFYNDLRGVSCPTARMCMAVGMDYRYNTANASPGPHVGLAELYRQP